jgi:2-polyprenyl-6-methoxyphenol hydroxylase-like FAD-dependent oxidoreductase
MFVTAQPAAHARFRRAIARRALWLAEDAARELPNLALEDALQLVHLYAERGSPKYEKAALRWLERYLSEAEPSLVQFARLASGLAKRADDGAT